MNSDFTYRSITLDSYFDKIFYVNLEKDADRDQSCIEQFKRFGITNYERVEGVKLSELPSRDHYRNFIHEGFKYTINQLGCRESHLKCIREAKNRSYARVLILEDDFVFLQDPNELLRRNQDILNDWDMLYFGGLVEPFFRNQIVTTHAYAIHSKLFDDVLNMATSSGMEIDNFYAKIIQHMSYNHNQSGKYNIRIVLPFNQIIQNQNFESNIK